MHTWLCALAACLLLGDVNGNGIVNATDANEIQRHSVPLPPITSFNVECCDYNENGICNAADAQKIQDCAHLGTPVYQLRNFCWLQSEGRADAYVLLPRCFRGNIDFSNHEQLSDGRYCVELYVPLPNTFSLVAFNKFGQSSASNAVTFFGGAGNEISLEPIDLRPDRLSQWFNLD